MPYAHQLDLIESTDGKYIIEALGRPKMLSLEVDERFLPDSYIPSPGTEAGGRGLFFNEENSVRIFDPKHLPKIKRSAHGSMK